VCCLVELVVCRLYGVSLIYSCGVGLIDGVLGFVTTLCICFVLISFVVRFVGLY